MLQEEDQETGGRQQEAGAGAGAREGQADGAGPVPQCTAGAHQHPGDGPRQERGRSGAAQSAGPSCSEAEGGGGPADEAVGSDAAGVPGEGEGQSQRSQRAGKRNPMSSLAMRALSPSHTPWSGSRSGSLSECKPGSCPLGGSSEGRGGSQQASLPGSHAGAVRDQEGSAGQGGAGEGSAQRGAQATVSPHSVLLPCGLTHDTYACCCFYSNQNMTHLVSCCFYSFV